MADSCVSRVPVFASLSAQDQQRVERLARPTHLKAGEAAYRADDDLSQLMVLHSGRLKIFRLSADGSEQLIRVLGQATSPGRHRFSRASGPMISPRRLGNPSFAFFATMILRA